MTNKLLADESCGIKSENITKNISWRIYGGNDTKYLEYPWMAFLACGGSIINDQWVITAAHCISKLGSEPVQFWLGIYDLERYNERNGPIKPEETAVPVYAEKVIHHPKYFADESGPDGGRPQYDVSLIKLKQKLDFNGTHKFLRPICLPNKTSINDVMKYKCSALGWGATNRNSE